MAPDYKPTSYTYHEYRPSEVPDPVRHRDYNLTQPTEYKPTNLRHEYKPYKPSHVGIYGETQRPKQVRIRPDSPPKANAPRKTRTLRTFESYRKPTGPDIRVGDTGPDYKPHQLQPSDYTRAGMGTMSTRDVRTPVDPIRSRPEYKPGRYGPYTGSTEYRLTEENNPGMRHWRSNFVDDTVMAKRYESPERKYRPQDERKPEPAPRQTRKKSPEPPPPKRTETPEKPQTPRKERTGPVVAPIPVPVSPQKKKYKTQPTQTQPVKTSTQGTQSDKSKTKSSFVQTKTPLPVHGAAPLAVPTEAKSIQTSPALAPARESPVRARTREPPNVMHYDERKTPSPDIVPLVFAANQGNQYRRDSTPTPVTHDSPEPKTPKHESPRSPSNRYSQDSRPVVVPVVNNARESPKQKQESPKRNPTPVHQTPRRSPTPKQESPRSPTNRYSPDTRAVVVPVVNNARESPKQKHESPKRNPTPVHQTPRRSPTPKRQSPVMQREDSWSKPRESSPKYVSPVVVQDGSVHKAPTPKYESPVVENQESAQKGQTPKHESPQAPTNRYSPDTRPVVVPVVNNARKSPKQKQESPNKNLTPVHQTPRRGQTPKHQSPVTQREDSWSKPRKSSPKYVSPVVVQDESVHKAPTPKYESPVVEHQESAQKGQTPKNQSPKNQSPVVVSPQNLNRAPTPKDESPIPTEAALTAPRPKNQSPATYRKPEQRVPTPMYSRPEETMNAPKPINQTPSAALQTAVPRSEERSPFHAYTSPQRKSPSGSSRHKLPPEVVACLEAYDTAHSGGALPTIRRSMGLGGN